MCKRRSQVRHVGEEKGSPAQGAKHNACAFKKTKRKTRQNGKIRFAEASTTFL